MGSSARASDIGYRQKSANEVCQPVVGVGDVMEEVELPLFMQTTGREIGSNLPEVVVKLDAPLDTR